jgi:hypothetical protein
MLKKTTYSTNNSVIQSKLPGFNDQGVVSENIYEATIIFIEETSSSLIKIKQKIHIFKRDTHITHHIYLQEDNHIKKRE